jgi:hypothetical protein
MGQKLGCGDRDFASEAAEDDAADELRCGSRGSMRSKSLDPRLLIEPRFNELSINSSSFVGGGVVYRRRKGTSKNELELEQQNKLLKKQLKKAKAKYVKAKKAEEAKAKAKKAEKKGAERRKRAE